MSGYLSRKTAMSSVLVLVALSVAGIASAYWTTGGSGSGSATAGTTASVTVTQTGTPAGLYPGGSAALSGKFNNTNPGSVRIAAVTAAVTAFSSVANDGTKPACTQADFSITGTATVNAEIPTGNGVGSWSGLTLNMIDNAGANQENCKNITVPITYTST